MELKPDKGLKNGSCNRTACQKPGAIYYNHATDAYYCPECAMLINKADRGFWAENYGHELCTREV